MFHHVQLKSREASRCQLLGLLMSSNNSSCGSLGGIPGWAKMAPADDGICLGYEWRYERGYERGVSWAWDLYIYINITYIRYIYIYVCYIYMYIYIICIYHMYIYNYALMVNLDLRSES